MATALRPFSDVTQSERAVREAKKSAHSSPAVENLRAAALLGVHASSVHTVVMKDCTFIMTIDSVDYCFAATVKEGKEYLLTATQLDADSPIVYSGVIWINIDKAGQKSTPEVGKLELRANIKAKSLYVNRADLLKKWNEQAPQTASNWDFIVLEVYDSRKKIPPIRKVFWMTFDWSLIGTVTPKPPSKATVATFRVERGTFTSTELMNWQERVETIFPERVRSIIAGKSPVRTSVGFDPDTYVGMKVKEDTVNGIPWDERVGQSGVVTLRITDPPDVIKASFQKNRSDIPAGLMDSAVAGFVAQTRRILLYLQDTPDVDIAIYAYTDTVGDRVKNCALSQARAESAMKYFTDGSVWTGVGGTPKALSPNRIVAVQGEGEDLAEETVRKKYPKEYAKKLIDGIDDETFRRFEIKYVLR